jgi:hypothetical protein
MLASVYDVPLAERRATPLVGLMDAAACKAADRSAEGAQGSKRRNQIWELHPHLHCSIIGTCLTAGELRRLLLRLNVAGAETAGDHDAHLLGVLLAARPKEGARRRSTAVTAARSTVLPGRVRRPRYARSGRRRWRGATFRAPIGRC